VILPGEAFGSPINNSATGFGTVVRETAPFIALGSLIGITGMGNDPPFSPMSATRDFAYLMRSGQTFNATSELQGLAK
jgi:hypothetical protein